MLDGDVEGDEVFRLAVFPDVHVEVRGAVEFAVSFDRCGDFVPSGGAIIFVSFVCQRQRGFVKSIGVDVTAEALCRFEGGDAEVHCWK